LNSARNEGEENARRYKCDSTRPNPLADHRVGQLFRNLCGDSNVRKEDDEDETVGENCGDGEKGKKRSEKAKAVVRKKIHIFVVLYVCKRKVSLYIDSQERQNNLPS